MSEAAKRLTAAVFVRVTPRVASAGPLVERLARLRALAEQRGYDVVLERTDAAPPWRLHAWIDDLLDGADAGTFQVLLVEDARELGDSVTDAEWLRAKLERLGVWIIDAPPPQRSVLGPVPEGRPSLAGA